MTETSNQTQPVNLSRQLQSLSMAVHSLLQSENINLKSIVFYETNLIDLALNLVFHGLVPIEKISEIEQINNAQERLEKLLEILDEYLKNPEEDLIESIVPQGILEGLIEESEAAAVKNQALIEKIESKNEARLEQIKRRAKLKEELARFTRQPVLEKNEIQQISEAVTQEVQPEISALRDQAERAQDNDILRMEIQVQGQAILEKTINQLDVDNETKQYLLSRKLSTETLIELATKNNPDETRRIIHCLLSPILPRKAEFIQREILSGLTINAVNTTETQDVQRITSIAVGEKLQELQDAGFSQDEILNLIFDLSRETQRLIEKNPPQVINFSTAPAIILSEEQLHISLTAPQPPGNPQGNTLKILIDGEKTLDQKIIEIVAVQKINPQTTKEINNKISNLKTFKLIIQGYSPEGLEKLSAIKAREGTSVGSKLSVELTRLANNLRVFQKGFPKPLLIKTWQSNRLKAIREIVNKIPSPKKIVYKKAVAWIAKTGVGKAFKSLSVKIAQKGLQKLWGFISKETIKKVARQTIKTVALKVVSALGLDALAGVLSGGIGTVVLLVIQIGWEAIKLTINIGKKLLVALSAGLIKEEDLQLKKILILVFIVIFVLPVLDITSNTGGAFLSQGRGGFTEELPGHPVFPSGEPNCDDPEFAEKIICKLSKGEAGCKYSVINELTWPHAQLCLTSSDFERVETIKTAFINHIIPICNEKGCTKRNLQCVGFAVGVEAGQGRTLESRNAKDYLNPPEPQGYRLIHGQGATPKPGDLAIWKGSVYGHIAVVLRVTSGATMEVAESDGYNGLLDIKKNIPFGNPEFDNGISPYGFLRPI